MQRCLCRMPKPTPNAKETMSVDNSLRLFVCLHVVGEESDNWCVKLISALQEVEFEDKEVANERASQFMHKFAGSLSRAT
jgi:hypothetical protein